MHDSQVYNTGVVGYLWPSAQQQQQQQQQQQVDDERAAESSASGHPESCIAIPVMHEFTVKYVVCARRSLRKLYCNPSHA